MNEPEEPAPYEDTVAIPLEMAKKAQAAVEHFADAANEVCNVAGICHVSGEPIPADLVEAIRAMHAALRNLKHLAGDIPPGFPS